MAGDREEIQRSCETNFTYYGRKTQRIVETDWILTIEESLYDLDMALREPLRSIAETEEVRTVETSRHVNSRSIRHLAQHAEYLRVGKEQTVMPAKILNVRREDTLLQYENRFLNTLIRRLSDFVERRCAALTEGAMCEESAVLELCADVRRGERHGRIRLCMEETRESAPPEDGEASRDWLARAERLRRITRGYCCGEFAMKMGNLVVRPPILATNAIQKNKHLSQCLRLFRFLEGYDGIGYRVVSEEWSAEPSGECLETLHDLLDQQYVVFLDENERNLHGKAVLAEHVHTETVTPPWEEPPDPLSSEQEQAICRAVEAALEADAILRGGEREGEGAVAVINLDTLCARFWDGEEITPQILRLRGMIPPDAGRVKVLARGQIDKALVIIADDFSAEAEHEIEAAGGKAVRRRQR